jgi:hypothetical protein
LPQLTLATVAPTTRCGIGGVTGVRSVSPHEEGPKVTRGVTHRANPRPHVEKRKDSVEDRVALETHNDPKNKPR